MSAAVILIVAVILLTLGYIYFGGFLSKRWGGEPLSQTPAYERFDGRDYVPAEPSMLLGQHFSATAGVMVILAPIQAAVFGWVPALLWIIIGGIFFAGTMNYGALLSSIRHKGGSPGAIIRETLGLKAQHAFTALALLILILTIAYFTSAVSSAFAVSGESLISLGVEKVSIGASAATVTVLFILAALLFGVTVCRGGGSLPTAVLAGVFALVLIIGAGMFVGINAEREIWIAGIAVYLLLSSLLPVWLMNRPHDYLLSLVLGGIILAAMVGIVGASLVGADRVALAPFTGFGLDEGWTMFPAMFLLTGWVTASGCGALICSGTTSKQLESEKDARAIGLGSAVLTAVAAVIALVVAGVAWSETGGEISLAASPAAFAGGVAALIGSFAGQGVGDMVNTLMLLALSSLALTTLDSIARVGRYMIGELFVPEDRKGEDLPKWTRLISSPLVSTLVIVALGCGMGLMEKDILGSVFAASNQLLAALVMMAVAVWLRSRGKSNGLLLIPMTLVLITALTYLVKTIISGASSLFSGSGGGGELFALIWSAVLIILAVITGIEAFKALTKRKDATNE